MIGGGEIENMNMMNRRVPTGNRHNFPGNHGGMNINMQGYFPGMNFPNMQINHQQQQQQQAQRPFSREELMLAHAGVFFQLYHTLCCCSFISNSLPNLIVEMEASQMLRACVRELELQHALQKAREDQLRSQFESRFSDSRRASTNSDTSEGLSSLAFDSRANR